MKTPRIQSDYITNVPAGAGGDEAFSVRAFIKPERMMPRALESALKINEALRVPSTGAHFAFFSPATRGLSPSSEIEATRFTGCILGGAVGDALGAPVEHLGVDEIAQRAGPAGVTHFMPFDGGVGKVTDDTQMSLSTAEGLLRGWVREGVTGSANYVGVGAHALLRWLPTQGRYGLIPEVYCDELLPGWLAGHEALHASRPAGRTCITSLCDMRVLGEPAQNKSKGSGGVMRVACVGLFAARLGERCTPRDAFGLACELAGLTHGHPTGRLSAGVFAVVIMALAQGVGLACALSLAQGILIEHAGHEETLRAIEKATALARTGVPSSVAIEEIGEGWVADEALGIAIYCTMVAQSFEQGVLLAVNHDGDSDTTGAMAGNLLGVLHGEEAIPSRFREQVELGGVITELALDLHQFPNWSFVGEGGGPAALWMKYPGF